MDLLERRWRGVTQRQAERNLAVAVERVLKAWDMGDDVSDAIEELREAALDYAAVEAGEPEFEVEVIEIDDQLEAGRPERAFGEEGRG